MSDYLSRVSMSKDDSFEKFYVVCQKKKTQSSWCWMPCEQVDENFQIRQTYEKYDDANKIFSSLVNDDKTKEFDFKIVEVIVESQTVNDTLGDIYSAERLRDPYTIKNHIDIRWHYDSDGEEPELDTPYMVKTKNKDGWQKTCIAKYVCIDGINMFVSLDNNEVIADRVIAWCSLGDIGTHLDVDADIRSYRRMIDNNYEKSLENRT